MPYGEQYREFSPGADEENEAAVEGDLEDLETLITDLSGELSLSPRNQETFDKIITLAENPEDKHVKEWLVLFKEMSEKLSGADEEDEDNTAQLLHGFERDAAKIGTH